ncbi:MAG: hypothetical protein IPP97_04270 [Candidatus Obscuribacter sp.]|nr:hypothetical protein [Candidatus Obscuribacter sp.]
MPHPLPGDLPYWRQYFKDRVIELRAIQGTPWGFACAGTLLEVLGKLARGSGKNELGKAGYIKFIREWLPEYEQFEYQQKTISTTKWNRKHTVKRIERLPKSLAVQMYAILRCGLVHSFSFVANKQQRQTGGRDRSIWLTTRAEAAANGWNHLGNFSRTAPEPAIQDAAVFVAEDFLDDLDELIDAIFDKANTSSRQRARIVRHLTEQRPIGL